MPRVKLSDIRIDGGTQPRAQIDTEVVADYAAEMKLGTVFPDVVVFFDGKHHWLGDGFHRYHGAITAECNDIAAEIRNGTKRDAILYSVGANAEHGLRRSNEDKRLAVDTLLKDEEWTQWSDHKIAKACAVSQPFVSNRRQLITVISCEPATKTRRFERGGSESEMRTASIGGKSTGRPRQAPCEEVVKAIDEAVASGDTETAEELRETLNTKSVSAATRKVEAAKTATEPAKTERLKDSKGGVVPDVLVPVFQRCVEFKSICRDLSDIRKQVKELAETDAGGRITFNAVKADIDNAMRHVKFAAPYAICPYCKATKAKCDACKATGWVSESIYNQAPPEVKK